MATAAAVALTFDVGGIAVAIRELVEELRLHCPITGVQQPATGTYLAFELDISIYPRLADCAAACQPAEPGRRLADHV